MVDPIIEYGISMCPLWKETLELPQDLNLDALTIGKVHKFEIMCAETRANTAVAQPLPPA